MTQLRQKMLEELQRRNYSHRTAKTYIRIVRDFAAHFHRAPDQLGPEDIRQFQAYLFQTKKLSAATVSQYVSALRFLFVKTLRRHFLTEHIPFPKSPRRLPVVLSPEEVTRLIDAACNLYHRTLLMTLYSTGVRRSELCRLQVSDKLLGKPSTCPVRHGPIVHTSALAEIAGRDGGRVRAMQIGVMKSSPVEERRPARWTIVWGKVPQYAA